MKLTHLSLAIIFFVALHSCQNSGQNQTAINSTTSLTTNNVPDTRAKDEIYFLNKVKTGTDTLTYMNSFQKDSLINAFNKYAIDSLKRIQAWEMIVTGTSDDMGSATSIAQQLYDMDDPIYNVSFVAPIKIDRSTDTIASDNRVDFVFTVHKNSKDVLEKKRLEMIKNLNKGDTVLVSGGLTHLVHGKFDFSKALDGSTNFKYDLLANEIKKKTKGK